jgi:NADPH:quinone reductase-like Zn-dependent oxidoreductase
MKAIVQDEYGPPEVLHLEEVERPTPCDGEVLVRVHAAGVDAGVWHLTAGRPAFFRLAGPGVRRPKHRVRGMDLAGVVEAVGPGVGGFQTGDEVFGACDGTRDGSFAEFACVPVGRLAPKPATLTFAQAAAVPVSGCTALQALRDVRNVQPGQTVLVTGAGGGVGSWAVQIANAFGAEVTGACSAAKADLVRSLGADDVVITSCDDTVEASRDKNAGRPRDVFDGSRRFDLIVDTAGRRPVRVLRRALAANGTLVIVGGEGGGRLLGGFDRQLIRAPLLALFTGQTMKSLMAKENREDLLALTDLISEGAIAPALDATFPLARAADAVRYLHEGRARGKIVLEIQ